MDFTDDEVEIEISMSVKFFKFQRSTFRNMGYFMLQKHWLTQSSTSN